MPNVFYLWRDILMIFPNISLCIFRQKEEWSSVFLSQRDGEQRKRVATFFHILGDENLIKPCFPFDGEGFCSSVIMFREMTKESRMYFCMLMWIVVKQQGNSHPNGSARRC